MFFRELIQETTEEFLLGSYLSLLPSDPSRNDQFIIDLFPKLRISFSILSIPPVTVVSNLGIFKYLFFLNVNFSGFSCVCGD